MNTYVVDREEDMVRSFLLDENSRAIEIHEDNLQRKFSLGDIYIAHGENASENARKVGILMNLYWICKYLSLYLQHC